MIDKSNNFVCIGAIHADNILNIKTNYYKNRTNPIKQTYSIGGVAFNIAQKLAFLKCKTKLFSFNCKKEIIKKISKTKIIFKQINNKIHERSYITIVNSKGKMILGLADMDIYEKPFNINKKIFDLNFSKKIIEVLINKYSKYNLICVCGTSAHKIYKIKKIIHKINILILNKQESLNLTNKKNIDDALKYIINKNNKITVVISNGRHLVNAYHNKNIYHCYPPKINTLNENKSGDIMCAFFYYYFCKNLNFDLTLKNSIVAGSLHASGFNFNINDYNNKICKISKKLKFNSKTYDK